MLGIRSVVGNRKMIIFLKRKTNKAKEETNEKRTPKEEKIIQKKINGSQRLWGKSFLLISEVEFVNGKN